MEDGQLAVGLERGDVRVVGSSAASAQDILLGRHVDWVRAVATASFGDALVVVSASDDGTIRGWSNGIEAFRITRHTSTIRALAAMTTATGSAVVVSAGTDGWLRYWDVAAGTETIQVAAHEGWIQSVAAIDAAADGAPLVVASTGRDGMVRYWDAGGKPARDGDAPGGVLRAVTLSRAKDGTAQVAVAREDGTVFRGPPGELVRWHDTKTRLFTAASQASNDDLFTAAVGGPQHLSVWNGQDWLSFLRVNTTIRAVALVPRQETTAIAAVGSDGRMLVWDSLNEGSQALRVSVSDAPLWAAKHVRLAGRDAIGAFGDDRVVHVMDLDGTSELLRLEGHTGRGRALTTTTSDDRALIVSAGTDGTIRLWDHDGREVDRWPRLPEVAVQAPLRDLVRVGPDEPATDDKLDRRAVAAGLAAQLRHLVADETEPLGVLPVLIDAPWGAGKSSLVKFLQAALSSQAASAEESTLFASDGQRAWASAPDVFDAWRESQVGPAWWSMLNHLRSVVRSALPNRRRRWWFGVRSFFDRITHAYRSTLVVAPVIVVVVSIAGLWATSHLPWADQPARPTGSASIAPSGAANTSNSIVLATTDQSKSRPSDAVKDLGTLAESATKLAAFFAVLLGAWFTLVRLGLWYTPLGARLHQRTSDNPMASVLAHFAWLRRQGDRPLLLIVDDLDRCHAEYTVSVLETIQTLMRPSGDAARRAQPIERTGSASSSPSRTAQADGPQPIAIVVAADSAWLRSAIEQHYANFTADVSRPGSSLGWLFLDKLFPVRIRLADPNDDVIERYVDQVLDLSNRHNGQAREISASDRRPAGEGRPGEYDRAAAIRRVRAADTLDAKEAEIDAAPAEARPELRVAAAATSITPSTLTESAHLLSAYRRQIARAKNPRTIKRFRNAYILNRIAFGGVPDADTIVRWTLLEVQWPDLAEQLRINPDLVTAPPTCSTSDATTRSLLDHPDVRDVVTGLTAEKLRAMLRLSHAGSSLDEPAQTAGKQEPPAPS